MLTNEIMLMISNMLYGSYDAAQFSYDFPAKLVEVSEAFERENPMLSQLLGEELPEICGFFDPYDTHSTGTHGENDFRRKVLDVYKRAVPLSEVKQLVS